MPPMADLHVPTPLWESLPLTAAAGVPVRLKMEAFQPTGSFKLRGIGRACAASLAGGARRLICSSGGNAGLAVAHAGRRLGVPVEVVVPRSTPEFMREVIRREGATVREHGAAWDDAHAFAVDRVSDEVAYIHPFDDPRIWAGHATLVGELPEKPGAVVLSVGGGGLLLGVLQGLRDAGWADVPVVAVETAGAASFARSVAAGELVTLPAIETVATSLGARTVAGEALAQAARHEVRTVVVSDMQAVLAVDRFATDHRVLVEPACGAALATVYELADALAGVPDITVIVCGGAATSPALLRDWCVRVGVPDRR